MSLTSGKHSSVAEETRHILKLNGIETDYPHPNQGKSSDLSATVIKLDLVAKQ